jgi:hypothetical protein
MRHEPTGLDRWANIDPSLHYNRIDPQPSGRWVGVWIYLLKVRDYEAAEMVRRSNQPAPRRRKGDDGDDDQSRH